MLETNTIRASHRRVDATDAPAVTAADVARLRTWMVVHGIVALAGAVVLLLFFALARPFGGIDFAWMWLGPISDWLGVLDAIPACVVTVLVALGVRGGAAGWALSILAVISTLAGAVVTLLMLAGIATLDAQFAQALPGVAIAFGWFAWAGVRLARTGLLPRWMARAAVAIALAVAAGGAGAALGLVLPPVLAPAMGIGLVAWVASPVWWLVAGIRVRAPRDG